MLLASDTYRCMFVIGMDPQMIAAALEKAHEDMRERLPRYERSVPLGWRFMDKFVQMPFTIPPSSPERLRTYANWLGGVEIESGRTEPPASVALKQANGAGAGASPVISDARTEQISQALRGAASVRRHKRSGERPRQTGVCRKPRRRAHHSRGCLRTTPATRANSSEW